MTQMTLRQLHKVQLKLKRKLKDKVSPMWHTSTHTPTFDCIIYLQLLQSSVHHKNGITLEASAIS